MDKLGIDNHNERDKNVPSALSDCSNNHYRANMLSDEEIQKMLKRKADFTTGKTSSRPWNEVRKQYEDRHLS